MRWRNSILLQISAYAIFFLYLSTAFLASHVINETVTNANASYTVETNLTVPGQTIHEQTTLFPVWALPLFIIKPFLFGVLIGSYMVKTNRKGV